MRQLGSMRGIRVTEGEPLVVAVAVESREGGQEAVEGGGVGEGRGCRLDMAALHEDESKRIIYVECTWEELDGLR